MCMERVRGLPRRAFAKVFWKPLHVPPLSAHRSLVGNSRKPSSSWLVRQTQEKQHKKKRAALQLLCHWTRSEYGDHGGQAVRDVRHLQADGRPDLSPAVRGVRHARPHRRAAFPWPGCSSACPDRSHQGSTRRRGLRKREGQQRTALRAAVASSHRCHSHGRRRLLRCRHLRGSMVVLLQRGAARVPLPAAAGGCSWPALARDHGVRACTVAPDWAPSRQESGFILCVHALTTACKIYPARRSLAL
jgi:hypothetical protein